VCPGDDATVVHVAGRLSLQSVGDLERTIEGTSGLVILDLTSLVSADDAGVATLRLLMGSRVQLRGASPYITLLLGVDRPPGSYR
jgi:anti-anti-sigma regulatory factor